jgi:Carboxypeptidase regulatory-like domain/TonB dependent receptor
MERSQVTALSRRLAIQVLLLFILMLGTAWSANAQSTATLQGTVTDPAGASVPNAKIVVTNEATGVQSETVSDSAGAYLFPSLSIGNYKLEISASGFKKVALAGLKLDVATAVTQNVQLKVGEATESIEIVADAPLIDTVTTSVGQVINDKTVQEIPLNGRHFTDLSLLTPGTVTPPANGFLSAPLRGQGSFGINTAGQREDTTNWLVNGINLNDPVQNQITFQPPIDTLAEYKIDNSSFPAEYGRNSGAIVNLATRSGTSEYHGELFEFFRNNALDARNFFNTSAQGPQAPYKKNDFGADFGGPIVKNKVFFFVAYEGIRQHQNITASTTVPSQNQRATVTSPAVTSLLALLPPANFHQKTDVSTAPADFTGFTGGAVANVSLNQGSGDLDIELRQQDRIHAYYVVQKDLRQEPLFPTVLDTIPGFGDTRDGFRQLLTVSEDHTFSASLANTVRLGYNRIHLTFLPNALLDPAAFNITLPAGAPVASGLPDIQVAGTLFFGGPNAEPQGRGDTTVVLNDTLSWLKGRHSFAFGGEIRRAYNNNIAENVGTFAFTTFANFLNDRASSFTTQLGAGNDKILQPSYDGFAQDTFKWKPNFTINLGLRYAWNSTPSEAAGRFTNFDPATGTLISTPQPYHTNNKNFQPRVGFAWDPFKDGKTSVRAAYAILTQDPTTNTVSGLSSNPPFALPITAAPTATTPLTLENPSSGVKAPSLGPFAINPNFNDAYSQDWNLTIQRQMTASLGVEVAYVGVKGTHLQLNENINQPFVTNGFYGSTRPFPTLPQTSPVLPAQCVATTSNPKGCTLNNFNQVNSVGNSNYNALWVKADKHFSHGLQFLATYTYAKALDYNSLSTGESLVLQNAYNPRGDYGLSEYDVRHRFVVSGFYELPFKANRLVSGWQVGLVQQAQTGSPLTPSLTINPSPSIPLTVRPDLIGNVQTTGNPSQYFANKAVFVSPCVPAVAPATLPTCHPGTLGRNAITGPGFVDSDFSITKNTKINERFNLQFRSEFFDIFNHPNFGNPVLTLTSSSFGQIQSTRFPTGDFGSARQIQFALKLMF